jgi:nitrogen-specific signal transduction histidine kinase
MAPLADPQQRCEDLIRLLAHDLRNPLTAVQLNGQLLEQAAQAAGLAKHHRWARLVVEAARRINDLVGKLVEAERLRAGSVPLARETVLLTELVPDVVAALGEDGGRFCLRLLPEAPAISGDRVRLGQALTHLLRVVAAEADPDSAIAVALAARDDRVTCSIRAPRPRQALGPDGSGAPPAGHGILEHFARTVVECHGGALRLHDEAAAFTYEVALPAAPAIPQRSVHSPTP